VKRSLAVLGVLGITSLISAWLSVGSAAADNIPFKDPNWQGGIAFCDAKGHAVTSGSLTAVPFVWTAISSVATPAGYTGKFGKATLGVFVPRKDVDPGEWFGKQFTAASTYTNNKHPIAQATYGDAPLVSLTSQAPPQWDGLLQVRMYFSNANTPPLTTPYPATVIQVTGNTWHVVKGASVACNVGKGVSLETAVLGSSKLPSAAPSVSVKGEGTQAKTSKTSVTASSHSAVSHSAAAASGGAGSAAVAAGNDSNTASGSPTDSSQNRVAIALAAAIVGGALVFGVQRLRTARAAKQDRERVP